MRWSPVALCMSLVCLSPLFPASAEHDHGRPEWIVEPLRLHHAFIADELKLNGEWLDGPRTEEGKRADGWRSTLETAWAWGGDRLGSEIFVPMSNLGDDREKGLGDIEIQPLKHAFASGQGWIVTGALGFGLNTGSRTEGLGEGHRTLEPHLLVDRRTAWGYLGFNLVPEIHVSGESASAVEYGLMAALPVGELHDGDWLHALSLELVGERGIAGEERRMDRLSAVLGAHLAEIGDWELRLGLELPLTSDREHDGALLLQIGTHRRWRR